VGVLPSVQKSFRRRRTRKMLEEKVNGQSSSLGAGVFWHELSIEDFIGKKLDIFFLKLGDCDADGLYDVVIKQVERPLIQKALQWAKGNQLKASRVLGINRNTLRSKIHKLKLK